MEINPNRPLDPSIPVGPSAKAKQSAAADNDGDASFEQSAVLNSALQAAPDSRAEVVSRAEDLVSSSAYPPREMIQRIANLLAANLIEETV
jgi:hypothetical protein